MTSNTYQNIPLRFRACCPNGRIGDGHKHCLHEKAYQKAKLKGKTATHLQLVEKEPTNANS